MTKPRPHRSRLQRGFSMIEVLVAVVVLGIGMAGVIGLQRVAASASGYSRRATEAAILAEDKLELLRTVPLVDLDGDDKVDSNGKPDAEGVFDRTWTFATVGAQTTITVAVSWNEADGAHTVTMRTMRLMP